MVLVTLVTPRCMYAQVIRAQAVLDTNTIDLGGQVKMNLIVEKPSGSVVEFPSFNDTLFGAIEILYKGEIDSSRKRDNQIILSQQLILTVFDTGLFYIPPIPFVYRSEQYMDTIRSAANYLEVLSFPIDTANTIRDIKGIYKAPLSFREIFPFVLLFLALILIVWFIVYYYKKKKRNEPIMARFQPIDPPDVVALRELDRLKVEKLWQQGRIKEYYSRLSEIIRIYIEGRYSITALEQTSYEILAAVQDILGRDSNYAMLKALLQLSDLVKFAKADPDPDENHNQLENAYLFIRNTRHQPIDDGSKSNPKPHPENINVEI